MNDKQMDLCSMSLNTDLYIFFLYVKVNLKKLHFFKGTILYTSTIPSLNSYVCVTNIFSHSSLFRLLDTCWLKMVAVVK